METFLDVIGIAAVVLFVASLPGWVPELIVWWPDRHKMTFRQFWRRLYG